MKYWEQETHTILRPEMAAADSLSLGVWLRILNYCAIQENGGRIINAATIFLLQEGELITKALLDRANRALSTTLGITRDELDHALQNSTIVYLEGTDLCILNYCHREQSTLAARREGGKKGGRPRLTVTQEPLGNLPASEVSRLITSAQTPKTSPSREREGKEKEGKERESSARDAESPSPDFTEEDFRNGAENSAAALAIANHYPANGSNLRAIAAIIRAIASGTITAGELRDKVTVHAARWHALPTALRRFCPGKTSYFEEARYNDDPNTDPWVNSDASPPGILAKKNQGAPPWAQQQEAPEPIAAESHRAEPAWDWRAAFRDLYDVEPLAWDRLTADVQREVAAQQERRAA